MMSGGTTMGPAPANGVTVPVRATATVGTSPLADTGSDNYATATPLAAKRTFVSGGVQVGSFSIPAWGVVAAFGLLYLARRR